MGPDADNLRLTDFLDLTTLQEIQDSFAAVAGVKATITDAAGNVLTQATPTAEFLRRQQALVEQPELAQEHGEYIAPIIVNEQRLGTLRMQLNGSEEPPADETRLAEFSSKLGVDVAQIRHLVTEIASSRHARPAAVQFLFLMANAIARLCFQEFQLRQRINELTAVYNVTMMLSEARDLTRVLSRTAEVVCDVMGCKASSIRLVHAEKAERVI